MPSCRPPGPRSAVILAIARLEAIAGAKPPGRAFGIGGLGGTVRAVDRKAVGRVAQQVHGPIGSLLAESPQEAGRQPVVVIHPTALGVRVIDVDPQRHGGGGPRHFELPAAGGVAVPERPRRVEHNTVDGQAKNPHVQISRPFGGRRAQRHLEAVLLRTDRDRVMAVGKVADGVPGHAVGGQHAFAAGDVLAEQSGDHHRSPSHPSCGQRRRRQTDRRAGDPASSRDLHDCLCC